MAPEAGRLFGPARAGEEGTVVGVQPDGRDYPAHRDRRARGEGEGAIGEKEEGKMSRTLLAHAVRDKRAKFLYEGGKQRTLFLRTVRRRSTEVRFFPCRLVRSAGDGDGPQPW